MKRPDLNTQKIKSIANALLPWFAKNARDLPWRRNPYCKDPYCVYVSEIMLQQTQVKTVIPYWKRWIEEFPTIEALAKAKPERVLKLWEGLGYYTRARNLHAAAKFLCRQSGGQFPRRFEEVLALPGVGRYTAGAICSIAYNQPTPVLDGNTIRVLCRIFGIASNPHKGKTNRRLWHLAEALVKEAARTKPVSDGLPYIRRAGNCARLNQALMELGAVVCTSCNPGCKLCPAKNCCAAALAGNAEDFPKTVRQVRMIRRRFAAFIIQDRGRFLARRRPAQAINGQLWEFPNIELDLKDGDLRSAAQQLLKTRPKRIEFFGRIVHTVTRSRITLEAYRITLECRPRANGTNQRWLTPADLAWLPFTSADRKLVQRLLAQKASESRIPARQRKAV